MENWAAALFVWERQTCLSSTGEVKPPKAKGTYRGAHDAEAGCLAPDRAEGSIGADRHRAATLMRFRTEQHARGVFHGRGDVVNQK